MEATDFLASHQGRPLSLPVSDNTVGLALLEAWPLKCAYAVQEIFKTEGDYIASLNDVIQGYRTPLSYRLKSDNEGHRIISTLFSNIDELYEMHKLFLEHLTTHRSDPHAFGQVFVSAEDSFKIYCEYCTNYDGAMECFQEITGNNKDIEVFINACQYNLSHALPLSCQLIKPVQRIMRYHIMLKEVVKHFNRNHHGFQSLKSAYNSMIRIGNYINEEKKKKENADRILDLQSNLTGWSGKDVKNLSAYGELIIEDSCKVGAKGLERQVILFNKLLLILKKKDSKRYTYKGHILAGELDIDRKFCEVNETMFKVSSLLHRHPNYVIDLGKTSKQKIWLNKMQALINQIVEQANTVKVSPQHQIKRRKIEEIEVEDCSIETDSAQPKAKASVGPRFKVGRILNTKRRSYGDVRDLFPNRSTDSNVKLMSYSVGVDDVDDGSSIMQDIPENEEAPIHVPQVHQIHQEVMMSEPESNQSSKPDSRKTSGSNSMDSMVSLNDVDFGMEEHAEKVVAEEGTPKKSKLMRRAAIKVKRSKTLNLGGSYSSIIKARAHEARAASISPPPLPPRPLGKMVDENGVVSEGDDDSGSSVSHMTDPNNPSLQIVPESTINVPIISETDTSLYNDSSMQPHDVTSHLLTDKKGVPTTSDVLERVPNRIEADTAEDHLDPGDIVTRISPTKRPRPLSDTGVQDVLEVEIVHVDDAGDNDDGLELGESCGQSKLKGRDVMPSTDATDGVVDLDVSGGGDFLNASCYSSYLDDSVDVDKEEDEEGFMIVEDSSDSEDESVEDLEMSAHELETCFLEAVEMGEAALPEEVAEKDLRGTMESTTNSGSDVVPMEGTQEPWVPDDHSKPAASNVTEFFTTLNESSSSVENADEPISDPSSGPSPFQFRASQKKHTADLYGTLPHKKKVNSTKQSSLDVLPLGERDSKQQNVSSSSPKIHARYTTHRSDGFSRLLEFTRQQVEKEPEPDNDSDFDVTQSLPVLDLNILNDASKIEEEEDKICEILSESPEYGSKSNGDRPSEIVDGATSAILKKAVTFVPDLKDTDRENVEHDDNVSLGSLSHDVGDATKIETEIVEVIMPPQIKGTSPSRENEASPKRIMSDGDSEMVDEEEVPQLVMDDSLATDPRKGDEKVAAISPSIDDNSTQESSEPQLMDDSSSLATDLRKGDEVTSEIAEGETISPSSDDSTAELVLAQSHDYDVGIFGRLSRGILSRGVFVAIGVAVLASLVYYACT